MAVYVVSGDLTPAQRKGLRFWSNHIPGPEIAGEGPFATGEAFATGVLKILGDKGFAAREAAKTQRRKELYDAAANPTTKATIEATIAAEFTETE